MHALHFLDGTDDEIAISIQDAPRGHWSAAIPQIADTPLVLVVALRADLAAQRFRVRFYRMTIDTRNHVDHFAQV